MGAGGAWERIRIGHREGRSSGRSAPDAGHTRTPPTEVRRGAPLSLHSDLWATPVK